MTVTNREGLFNDLFENNDEIKSLGMQFASTFACKRSSGNKTIFWWDRTTFLLAKKCGKIQISKSEGDSYAKKDGTRMAEANDDISVLAK